MDYSSKEIQEELIHEHIYWSKKKRFFCWLGVLRIEFEPYVYDEDDWCDECEIEIRYCNCEREDKIWVAEAYNYKNPLTHIFLTYYWFKRFFRVVSRWFADAWFMPRQRKRWGKWHTAVASCDLSVYQKRVNNKQKEKS